MTEQSYTGANLKKQDQALTSLSVQPHRSVLGAVGSEITGREEVKQVNVTGEFKVTVKNTGILPVFNASVRISELSLVGVTVLEGETKSLATMSGGQEDTATFTFDVVSDKTSFVDTMRQLCGGSMRQVPYELEGTTGGFVIGTSIDSSGTIAPGSKSCNLPTAGDGGSDQPGEGEPGDGDGSNGGDGSDGGNGRADTELVIEGPDSPETGESVGYTLENNGEPFNAVVLDYYWYVNGEQIDEYGRSIDYTFTRPQVGSGTITAQVQDGVTGSLLGSSTKELDIQQGETQYDLELEGPDTVEAGERAEFEVEGEGLSAADTYTWEVNGQRVRESTSLLTYTFGETQVGPNTVTCTVIDASTGDISQGLEKEVEVESSAPDQGGQIEGPTNVTAGEPVDYEFSKRPDDYGAISVLYDWYLDQEHVHNGREPTITFESGEHTLRCVASDMWSGDRIDSDTIQVNAGGSPTVDATVRYQGPPSMSDVAGARGKE